MCDIQFSAQVISRKKHISDLRKSKGHGVMSFQRYTHYFTRIAVDTGGNVNTKHCFSASIDQFHDFPVQSPNIPCKACTKNAVHNGVAMVNIPFHRFDGFKLADFYGQPGYNVEVQFRCTLEFTLVS